jgi:hypothetical protein
MKRTIPISAGMVALFTLLLTGGCRRATLAPPPDGQQARDVLTQALDAWKRGDKAADLQARAPTIHVADMDWRAGWKLDSYKVLTGEAEHGSSLRVNASLSLLDPKGRAAEKKVAYLIGTSPVITVVREFE